MCAPKIHRQRNNNKKINNMLLLFEKRRGTACGGGDEKTQAKKVKLPTPCGYSLFITKKRESFNCPSAPTENKTDCHFEPCVRNLTIQWHFEISRIRSI